jgi:hypothetical protein
MFDEEEVDEDEVDIEKAKNPLRINKSLHLRVWDGFDSTEVSMKNKDSLTVKFSDDENTYNLYIKEIDIKQFYLRTDKMTLLLMMRNVILNLKYDLDTF